jgi:hypothetical protein
VIRTPALRAISTKQFERACVQVAKENATERTMVVKLSSFQRSALGVCAIAATLSACGGVRYAPTPAANQARTWMTPDATKRVLIYAGGDEASYVFAFPGGKLVGNIAGTSFGTCSDANGDVFFTQVKSIVEYQHGGTTPIATFAVPGTAYSCSVDSKSGNLAAVVFCISKCGEEVVVLRAPGISAKTYHVAALSSLLYCAYDDDGNLFVDGYSGTQFGLAELTRRGSAFSSVTLNRKIRFGTQLEWDGRDLAIETRENPEIYRVRVSGSTGKVVGTTQLTGVGNRATQSWIANGTIAVPTGPRSKRAIEIILWNYPAGGNPTKTITGFIGGGHQMIDGVTFSIPPKN